MPPEQPIDSPSAFSALLGALSLPEILLLLRRRHALNQHEVAVQTDIPAPYISAYETKRRAVPQEHLDRLYAFFSSLRGG